MMPFCAKDIFILRDSFKDTNITSAPINEECQDIVVEPMQQESSQYGDSLLSALHASVKRTHSHDEEGKELLSPGKRPRLADKGGHPESTVMKVADSPMPVRYEPMKDEPEAVQEASTDNKIESSEPKNLKSETEELVKLSQTLKADDKDSHSNTIQNICDHAELLETKDDKLKQEDDPKLQIVFSDEEDEGVAGGSHVTGGGRMLSSQMNRQIDRVQVFLKLERLRRPKK